MAELSTNGSAPAARAELLDEGWVEVAPVASLAPGACRVVEAGDEEILVSTVDGRPVAVDAICSHAFAYLDEGAVEGHEIVCPLHFARFDLRTGAALKRPAREPLRTYPVTVIDGMVLVRPTPLPERPDPTR